LKNAILICNPTAGSSSSRLKARAREAVAILREGGIEATVAFTSGSGDGKKLAQAAVNAGRELIIVCGGDGTINEVINGMGPAKVPLAILPAGTANIVGREVGLPTAIQQAARELPGWRPCRIALGRATWGAPESPHQRYFIAVAGIGFDAHIISKLDFTSKLRLGVVAYGWEALRQVFRYDFPRFQCTLNGLSVSPTFAVVQRSLHYAGWLRLARSHGLHQSQLACCFFSSRCRVRYFLYALAVLTRMHHRLRDVRLLQGDPVVCIKQGKGPPIHFEVDGELAGQIPVTFEVVPDALTLLAPQRFVDSARMTGSRAIGVA
jgi:diacylglycerol kinase (ATP)